MDRLTHPRNNGIKTGYWSPEKKDALIERLAAYEDTGLTPEEVEELKDFYRNPLNTAVPILEQVEADRWIPVEERMPEWNVLVLVTVSGFYNEITCDDSVALGCLSVDGKWFLDGYLTMDNPKVIAWMPLPEPYREES